MTYTLAPSLSPKPPSKAQSASALSQRALARTIGVLDASVVAAYAIGVNPTYWHYGLLAIKVWLALTNVTLLRTFSRTSAMLFGAAALMVFTSSFSGVLFWPPYIQAGGFLAEFTLTCLLVSPNVVRTYMSACTLPLVACSGLHAALSAVGHMPQTWGRYFYFGSNQPNLGGEINAAAAILAALSFRRRETLAFAAILLVDTLLLQSRSAILTIVATVIVRLIYGRDLRFNTLRTTILSFMALLGTLTLLLTKGASIVTSTASSILQVNDTHRGLATGFSGRDELWAFAMELFHASPIIGHPLGYFDRIGYIGPHNIFLFGLAQNGIASVPFFAAILYGFTSVARRSTFDFCCLACVLPLFLFNDRLLNLNPYPFLVYVVVGLLAARTGVEPPPRSQRAHARAVK